MIAAQVLYDGVPLPLQAAEPIQAQAVHVVGGGGDQGVPFLPPLPAAEPVQFQAVRVGGHGEPIGEGVNLD